jgi:hypothetical protein
MSEVSSTRSTSASSNANIAADILRLIAPSDRPGYEQMLEHALRGRELPTDELRRIAERTWAQFCKHGWPRDT